jgi:hypothetical protein
MATCDSVENVCIAKMLWNWPDLSPGLVQASSLATRLKFIAGVFTEILMAALAIPALLRWRRWGEYRQFHGTFNAIGFSVCFCRIRAVRQQDSALSLR